MVHVAKCPTSDFNSKNESGLVIFSLFSCVVYIENNYCTVIIYYTPVSFYLISVPFVLGCPHQVSLVDHVVPFGQPNPTGTENCVFLDDSRDLKQPQASHIGHYLGTM